VDPSPPAALGTVKLCDSLSGAMSEFLVEAARHNPAIAHSLKKLRQRAESAIRDAAVADTVLDARDLGPGEGVVQPRTRAPSSAALPAARGLDLTKSWSTSLLNDVAAPDVFAVKPLAELELLALRSAQQLRRRHARLRQATVAVSVLTVAMLAIGGYTATIGDPKLAAGLVLGGSIVLALVVLKWQPFRRAARSAELAELADAMATNLRLRVRALEEQQDAKARQLEQWKAIVDLTEAVSPG
jgi:hypothetical protein